jgi:hypothetical protein
MEQAESILNQLLKFTAQLAELESDPEVDAKVLSSACIMRLDELKRLMPQDLKSSPASTNEILGKMRDLYDRTQACLEILGRKNNRLAAELQSLSRTRQAIDAYTARRGRSR